MAEWDTRALCARIANAARMPRGSAARDITAILPIADQHLRGTVLPELLRAGEGHLATTVAIPLVAGQANYRLPWRCVRVLGLHLRNAQGRTVRDFGRATPQQALRWHSTEEGARGTPRLWHLEASSLAVYPVPAAVGDVLVLRFARRPGRLVDSEAAAPRGNAVVTAASMGGVGSGTLTLTVSPSGAFGTTGSVSIDVLRGTPGFESLADDITLSVMSGGAQLTTTAFNLSTLPVAVGDYISLAGTSPVPQVPPDWHGVLESCVVEQLRRNSGDTDGAAAEAQARLLLIQSASATIGPRSTEPELAFQDCL